MTEGTRPSQETELPEFNNVQIQILAGAHQARNEREFAQKRKTVMDQGSKFYKRGFTNLFFMEDGRGALPFVIDDVNAIAKEHRSYRFAFWHKLHEFSKQDSAELVKVFEENPIEKFTRSGEEENYHDSFFYSLLSGLDSLNRSGFNVTLLSEEKGKERDQMLSEIKSDSEDEVGIWRKMSYLNQDINKVIAKQLTGIMSANPKKTRLMGSLGTLHAPVIDFLPPALKVESEVNMLDGEYTPSAQLMMDILSQDLTDEQISQRLKSLIQK